MAAGIALVELQLVPARLLGEKCGAAPLLELLEDAGRAPRSVHGVARAVAGGLELRAARAQGGAFGVEMARR